MKVHGRITDAETMGLFLQQGRLARGLTQRDLAAQLGISQRWISEMEAGKPGILMDRLFAMLRATGVSITGEFETPDA